MIRKFLSALSSSFTTGDEQAGYLQLADLRTDPSTPLVTAELCELRGFRVVVENSRPDIATDTVLARLDEALGLIDRYQPWRLSHLRRDLAQFRIVRFPCRGAFIPDERSCVTELTFLARIDITAAPVASSVVHEGIHARVHAMGVRADGRDRAREERLCRRAELEFGLSLPPELGALVVERAMQSLALADMEVAPQIDWAEAGRRQALVDQSAPTGDRGQLLG